MQTLCTRREIQAATNIIGQRNTKATFNGSVSQPTPEVPPQHKLLQPGLKFDYARLVA